MTHTVAVAPKCRTVYDAVTTSGCSTVSEPVRSTRSVPNYKTKHEQKCSSRPVEECQAVSREVPREQCSTHTEQECRNIVDTTQEQQCTTQQCHDEQVCMEEQQCSTQVSSVVDTSFTEECVDVVEQLLALLPLLPLATLLHLLLLLPQLRRISETFQNQFWNQNVDNRSQCSKIKSFRSNFPQKSKTL